MIRQWKITRKKEKNSVLDIRHPMSTMKTMKNFKKLDAALHLEKWQESYAPVVAQKGDSGKLSHDDVACDISMTGKGPEKPGHEVKNFRSSNIYKIWKDTCIDSEGRSKGGSSSTYAGDVFSTTTQNILKPTEHMDEDNQGSGLCS